MVSVAAGALARRPAQKPMPSPRASTAASASGTFQENAFLGVNARLSISCHMASTRGSGAGR